MENFYFSSYTTSFFASTNARRVKYNGFEENSFSDIIILYAQFFLLWFVLSVILCWVEEKRPLIDKTDAVKAYNIISNNKLYLFLFTLDGQKLLLQINRFR